MKRYSRSRRFNAKIKSLVLGALLILELLLLSSCATSVTTFSTRHLKRDQPDTVKIIEIRKSGIQYFVEYDVMNSFTHSPSIPHALFSYEKMFFSMDSIDFHCMGQGKSLPTLPKSKLVFEKVVNAKFESGRRVEFAALGCPESPLVRILDDKLWKTPLRVGLVGSAAALDAALLIHYPLIGMGLIAGGSVLGLAFLFLFEGISH